MGMACELVEVNGMGDLDSNSNPPILNYASVPAPQANSGLGIASMVIGIAVWVMEFAGIGFAAMLVGKYANRQSPAMIFAGLGIISGVVLALVGVGLGIAALCQRDRKKIGGILGLVFNGLMLLIVGGFMILGLIVRK